MLKRELVTSFRGCERSAREVCRDELSYSQAPRRAAAGPPQQVLKKRGAGPGAGAAAFGVSFELQQLLILHGVMCSASGA